MSGESDGGNNSLLAVSDLDVAYGGAAALDGVSLRVRRGECVGLLGESGAGKSTLVAAIVDLLDDGASVSGSVRLDGERITEADDARLRELRGARVGVAFQDGAFDPAYAVGEQIADAVHAHEDVSDADARERAVALLREVGVPDPETRAEQYPHQLSDGMERRARIAAALACDPDLLLLDEPTAGLDATVAAELLSVVRERVTDRTGALLVTHDVGVVAAACDRVAVAYAGRLVETGSVRDIFYRPGHPYTASLLAATPRFGGDRDRLPVLPGRHPDSAEIPSGCRFRDRCPYAEDACADRDPSLADVGDDGAGGGRQGGENGTSDRGPDVHRAACLAHVGALDGDLDFRVEHDGGDSR